MSKVLVLTHGEFSKGIEDSVNLIIGKVSHLYTKSIQLDTDITKVSVELESFIEQFDQSEIIIIMTDIVGGSTTQSVINVLDKYENVYLVTGLNLGLLLSILLFNFSSSSDVELQLNQFIEESKKGITCISHLNNTNVLNDDEEL